MKRKIILILTGLLVCDLVYGLWNSAFKVHEIILAGIIITCCAVYLVNDGIPEFVRKIIDYCSRITFESRPRRSIAAQLLDGRYPTTNSERLMMVVQLLIILSVVGFIIYTKVYWL